MPTTPIYALRYPAATDPADVPLDMSELALDVETKLGGAPVTSLPGSPVDGQVVRYRVATDGPVWTLQYLSSSAAPYRWHFLGGAERHARNDGGGIQLSPVGTWTAYNPTLVAPLAGIYRVTGKAAVTHGNAGVSSTGPFVAGSIAGSFPAGSAFGMFGTISTWAGGVQFDHYGEGEIIVATAGQTVAWGFYVSVTGITLGVGSLSLVPVKVA